jgi:hypothetical protein
MSILVQLKRIFEHDGLDFDCHQGQFWFAMRCGPFDATFRIWQNGFLTVLMATTDFTVPPEHRSAVAEFCGFANYALLVFGDIELNPEDGNVVLRHSFMVPIEGVLDDDQLRWFIASSARLLASMSKPIVTLASGNADVKAVLSEARQMLHPGLQSDDQRVSTAADPHIAAGEA